MHMSKESSKIGDEAGETYQTLAKRSDRKTSAADMVVLKSQVNLTLNSSPDKHSHASNQELQKLSEIMSSQNIQVNV